MVEPNGYGLRNIESSAGAPTDSYSGGGTSTSLPFHPREDNVMPLPPCPATSLPFHRRAVWPNISINPIPVPRAGTVSL